MPDRILVVDDEPEIADLVELYLKNENFEVEKFYASAEAQRAIEENPPDLAILDIMLPGKSGLELCRELRDSYQFPVILLTAKDAEIDKITGLALGADDYVTKPFRPLELVARVKAQLRRYKRYNAAAPERGILAHLGLVVDAASHEVTLNEKPLRLTPTEFTILCALLENKGAVVSSERLFHAVWGDEYYSKSSNTISVHVRHLREKMDDTGETPKYIKTVWGVGYKIEA